ncbi:phosphoglucosamine mutase [Patescibacteria group bacterium]|nr:phosphoglucosamine mutase [Patescibacteria group bacterium]MBU1501127.1 phosphoglucosamine mutase [Patescibacteria group bacterium]MBU2081000.1 phosphoglucosamine mutase [Patescibacteria group bacterium]MBU2124092.1 phosphoglucosamine mutase [Patescibacteria group bacterium]MBU2194947.1 phosphoglucosamine mutase [Patescibacteria group bacterium]
MNQRRYFGTDGVRGTVGTSPLTADFALRLANAAAQVLTPEGGRVLIGKDTRLSGYMFESALEAGFVAAGVDAVLIGPLPTPGIAYMTMLLECDFGVVISASHNKYDDNGIKFFDKNGEKISDDLELQIEKLLEEEPITRESRRLGRASRVDKMRTKYQDFCASTVPEDMTLEGFRLVVDCANGAGYKVAPRVFADLGADIVPIGTSPNGRNINEGCGSTEPELLRHLVPGVKADAGIALDGDGDRIVMVDAEGNLVDGDQILYILAKERVETGTLNGPVVGTVMSNLGLENAIVALGIPFLRAKVGDRYVLEMLRKEGGVLGGEPSGHVLTLDKTTTGDAIVVALQVLAAMKRTGKSLKELAEGMQHTPQVMVNVRLSEKFNPNDSEMVQSEVALVTKELGASGRVVLRASGTEPLVRVMVEAEDAGVAKEQAERLAEVVRNAAG